MMRFLLAAALTGLMIFAGCVSKPLVAGGASGTAEASAQGFHGPVTVSITVEKGKITRVEADGPDETAGIGTRALSVIPAQMLERNTVDVDSVSGATVTSEALLQAAREALGQIAGQ